MTVKKQYNINDDVWVHGINIKNTLTKGRVVSSIEIPGYNGIYYIIAIPTEIEDLLEIRTWENISQDENGPIGLFRDVKNYDSCKRYLKKLGLDEADSDDIFDPDPAEICAALEKSIDNSQHPPLIIKQNKQKNNRRFGRKRL